MRRATVWTVSIAILWLLSGCATPEWTDVPTGTWTPSAYDYNVRLCKERGLVFDHVTVECVQP